jgi:predicted ester cyclase
MSPTTNETIARSVFEDGLNGRDASVFEELVAADYVNHERADMLVEATGPKDWSDVLARLSAAFPDVAWAVLRTLAHDDEVWVETRMSGTHEGAFFGIPPTGRRFAVRQVHMLRLQDGLIREHSAPLSSSLRRPLGIGSARERFRVLDAAAAAH